MKKRRDAVRLTAEDRRKLDAPDGPVWFETRREIDFDDLIFCGLVVVVGWLVLRAALVL